MYCLDRLIFVTNVNDGWSMWTLFNVYVFVVGIICVIIFSSPKPILSIFKTLDVDWFVYIYILTEVYTLCIYDVTGKESAPLLEVSAYHCNLHQQMQIVILCTGWIHS